MLAVLWGMGDLPDHWGAVAGALRFAEPVRLRTQWGGGGEFLTLVLVPGPWRIVGGEVLSDSVAQGWRDVYRGDLLNQTLLAAREARRAARCLDIAARILPSDVLNTLRFEVEESGRAFHFRFTKRKRGLRMDAYDVGENAEVWLEQIQDGEEAEHGTVWFRVDARHFLAWDYVVSEE